MKSFSIPLLFASLAVAAPSIGVQGSEQFPLNTEDVDAYAGFNIDLNAPRLLQFENGSPIWMTELEKVLTAYTLIILQYTVSAFPTPNATERVKHVLKFLSTEGPQENLKKFTSFRTRHYLSDTGRQSQKWLLSEISELTNKYASSSLRELISLIEFPHSWGQNSIIARINGSSTEDDGVIVIGAHQDSTNWTPSLPAPGTHNDGSGSVTILEAYRALIAADFKPARTVEFHWYSAEEGGLLGSQAIVKDYRARSVNVIAMTEFDTTAWVKRGTREEVGIMVDFVNTNLTRFNMQLVDKYLDMPYVETKCGFACSDQASWEKAGYPSSFNIEGDFKNSNPNAHTTNDVIDISDEFSFSHMLEFSKLAVAVAIELGGWKEE
ncbi:peptidase [Cyathus striatus]|nr:peptidase [Cyathus striatus]